MPIITYTKGGITFQKNTYTGELKRIANQTVRDDPKKYRSSGSSSSGSSTANAKLNLLAVSNVKKANPNLNPAQRRIAIINERQRLVNLSMNNYFSRPTYLRQSVDENKIRNPTIEIVSRDKNGGITGIRDTRNKQTIGFSTPLTKQEILNIEQSRQVITSKVIGRGKVKPEKGKFINIGGVDYAVRTAKEREFLKYMKAAITTKDRWDKKFVEDITKRDLDPKWYDKWYNKALKGAGRGFAGIKSLPKTAANVLISIRGDILKQQSLKSLKKAGLNTSFAQAKAGYKAGRKARAKTVIPSVVAGVKSFNPVKPENWFNIATFIVTAPASVKPVKNTINKFKTNYVPSTRNTNAFKVLVEEQLGSLSKAKKFIKEDIAAGRDVFLNKRLLSKVLSVEKNLNKGYSLVLKSLKNPDVLKLSDFNPLVKSSKVLKEMGKENLLFHATGVKVKNLLGGKFKQLKSESKILSSVTKASGTAKRSLKPTSSVEKYLINFVKRNRGVVSGGKAQNLFVKRLLKRKTIDYDVLIKNNKLAASKLLSDLKRKFPKDKFELKVISPPGTKFKVYRIKWNGRDLVDFDPIPKDLGKTVVVDGVKVASPQFIAKRKASTIGDVKKGYRQAKDTKDLQRLTGNVFNDKKLFSRLKDPKDAFSVRPQPKGMGASRIKFGETQMFFDLEVPTSYAYNAIGVRSLTQRAITSLSKIKLPKGLKAPGRVTNKLLFDKFVKKINSYKFIKSNSKITVIKLSAKIDRLSPSLMRRVKNAAGLSAKDSAKLRVDVNNYINKNLNKVLGGSRTLSKGFGEREFVSPVGSTFYKQSLKKSFDPQTNTFIDVLEVGFKRAKKQNLLSSSSTTGTGINRLRLASFSELKNNFFTPSDFLKIRKFRNSLLKAEKLSSRDYNDIVSITLKMLRSKKGGAAFSRLKAKESKVLDILKKARRDKVYVIKKPSLAKAISLVGIRNTVKPSKASKVKSRVSSRVVSKPRKSSLIKPRVSSRSRVVSRSKSRSRTTPRPKTISRAKSRSKSRSRTTPRTKPRVTPRITPRVRVPVRVSPRVRPRITPRNIEKLRRIRKFSLKRKKMKFSKDEVKYMVKLAYPKNKYRPSLAALIYNITSFKVPKKLTGFEIRPIIKRKR